jgi:hypothetical protein
VAKHKKNVAKGTLGSSHTGESAGTGRKAEQSPWLQSAMLGVSLVVAFATHYMVTGHLEPEPTRKGIFSMEVTAFVFLLAAFGSGEVVKIARSREHDQHVGLTLGDVGLVLLSLLGSLGIYVWISQFMDA